MRTPIDTTIRLRAGDASDLLLWVQSRQHEIENRQAAAERSAPAPRLSPAARQLLLSSRHKRETLSIKVENLRRATRGQWIPAFREAHLAIRDALDACDAVERRLAHE